MRFSSDKEPHQPFLLKYEMSEDFISEYLATNELKNFKGNITKILLDAPSATSNRSVVNGDIQTDLNGNPCPGSNEIGSGGTDGSGSTGSGGNCKHYIKTTTWYTQACTPDGICEPPKEVGEESTLVSECSSSYASSDSSSDCNIDGEIPIIGPRSNNVEPIASIRNLLTNPCLKSQVDKATNNTLNSSLITQLKSALGLIGQDEFEIRIVENSGFSGGKIDGDTTPRNDFIIEIRLNPDLANSSQEYITTTIYHEYLHAIWDFYDMVRRFHDPNFQNPALTKLDALIATGMNINDAHHSLMLSDYMPILRDAVKNIHPNIGDTDLEAMTLHGIKQLTLEQAASNTAHRNASSGTLCN